MSNTKNTFETITCHAELAEAWDAWRDTPNWEKRGQPSWFMSQTVKDLLGLGANDKTPRWVKRMKRRDLTKAVA